MDAIAMGIGYVVMVALAFPFVFVGFILLLAALVEIAKHLSGK